MYTLHVKPSNAAAVAEATRPLLERIETMEKTLDDTIGELDTLKQRVKALEAKPLEAKPTEEAWVTEEAFLTHMDGQEWFWDKMRRQIAEVVDGKVEEAIEDHCQNYDHDDYDRLVSKVDELEDDSSLKEAIKDVLDNVSFDVRVSF